MTADGSLCSGGSFSPGQCVWHLMFVNGAVARKEKQTPISVY